MAVNNEEWEVFDSFADRIESVYEDDPDLATEFNAAASHLADLFGVWADPDISGPRHDAAFSEFWEILDYFGYDISDFDWEAFREAYSEN